MMLKWHCPQTCSFLETRGMFASEGEARSGSVCPGRLPVFWRPQAVRQRKLPYYTTPHAMLSISKCHKAWSACVRFKDAINLRLRVPQEFITSKTHFIASTYCYTLYWCPVDKLNTETMWTIGPRRK